MGAVFRDENHDRLSLLIRADLIDVACNQGKTQYGQLMTRFAVDRFTLMKVMSIVGHDCVDRREPQLTALIVSKKTGLCSRGLEGEFGVADDEAERQLCYKFWDANSKKKLSEDSTSGESADELEKRFVLVESRPQQAAFRLAVFRAFGGKCEISGCDIPEVLDAAHRTGRDWRGGHNAAADGILLRKDLHALYDRGLLVISMAGVVSVAAVIRSMYGEFNGKKVRVL